MVDAQRRTVPFLGHQHRHASRPLRPAWAVDCHRMAGAAWRRSRPLRPARAANEAHWAKKNLGNDLLGIEIGNEPNSYGNGKTRRVTLRPATYSPSEYLHEVEAYR